MEVVSIGMVSRREWGSTGEGRRACRWRGSDADTESNHNVRFIISTKRLTGTRSGSKGTSGTSDDANSKTAR